MVGQIITLCQKGCLDHCLYDLHELTPKRDFINQTSLLGLGMIARYNGPERRMLSGVFDKKKLKIPKF